MHLGPCPPRLILTLPLFLMSGCTPRADLAPVVLHNQRFSSFTEEIESSYRNWPQARETTASVEQNEIGGNKDKIANGALPVEGRRKMKSHGPAPVPSGTKNQAAKSRESLHAKADLSGNRQKTPGVRPALAPPEAPEAPKRRHGDGPNNALPEDRSVILGVKAKPLAEKPADPKQNTSINSSHKKKQPDPQSRPEDGTAANKKQVKLKKNSVISIDSKNMLMLNFQWPLKGKIKKNFSQTGSKGIDIIGSRGQTVRASEAGKVVYSGQGLIGFGNLLIIKHNSDYLSAYANNSSLMVKEGQKVKKGQDIAKLGTAASKKPVLHFEIRKNGKSVNPLSLLPSK